MAEVTKRKFLNFLSFFTSLLIAWLTGASSTAKENEQKLKTPVESSSWQHSISDFSLSTSALVPFGSETDPLETAGSFLHAGETPLVVAAYGGESINSLRGSGREPLRQNQFVPRSQTEKTTPRRERGTLERFLNTRASVRNSARRCETKVKRGANAFKCISEVLNDLEKRLVREANRGSSVAKSALPIVRQMKVEVGQAKSTQAAVAAMRRGIGKVQRLSLVRSQDTVIVNLQQQQRTVLAETLQAVEVSLVKAASI